MFKYIKISKFLIEELSIFFVILNEDCRRPRKLLFETELYESLNVKISIEWSSRQQNPNSNGIKN